MSTDEIFPGLDGGDNRYKRVARRPVFDLDITESIPDEAIKLDLDKAELHLEYLDRLRARNRKYYR